jgi:hypothetical protein
MLVRRHGARIDVQVGIQLLDRYFDAPALQKPTDCGGRYAFAHRGHHPSGAKDILGCHGFRSIDDLTGQKALTKEAGPIPAPDACQQYRKQKESRQNDDSPGTQRF